MGLRERIGRRRDRADNSDEAGSVGVRDVLEESATLIDEISEACSRAVSRIEEHLAEAQGEDQPSDRDRELLAVIEAVSDRAHELDGEAAELAEILARGASLLDPTEVEQDEEQSSAGWSGTSSNGESEGAQPSEGIRVLALQMAAAGSSREEIEERLQQDFGIESGAVADLLGDLRSEEGG